MKSVCVYGLGYVGLPTAAIIANHGYDVLGVDSREQVVSSVNLGRLPHGDEAGLAELVSRVTATGRLRAARSGQVADVHIISVGTPIKESKEPDLTQVVAVTREVARHLRAGDMVILESTVPPATCAKVLGPLLLELTGLDHEVDFGLGHCPERVLPGNLVDEFIYNARVVGGTTPDATRRTAEFYATFSKGAIVETDATTAEMCKLMENTYRDVNIALANVFAGLAKEAGIDIREAIALANQHPRVQIHSPGIGVGGHCIPVDPWFLIHGTNADTGLLTAARTVNARRPLEVVEAIVETVRSSGYRNVVLLGLTYKADVDDVRESPAVVIAAKVAETLGKPVVVVEPHLSSLPEPLSGDERIRLETLEVALGTADVCFRLVSHSAFAHLGARAGSPRLVEVAELIGPRPIDKLPGLPR